MGAGDSDDDGSILIHLTADQLSRIPGDLRSELHELLERMKKVDGVTVEIITCPVVRHRPDPPWVIIDRDGVALPPRPGR